MNVVVVGDRSLARRLSAQFVDPGDVDSLGPADLVVLALVDAAALEPRALIDTSAESWDERCEALLRSTVACLQAAYRALRSRGGGIVLVTPTIGMTGAAGFVPLATAIEAQRALAKSAARQWGADGVTVNCVAPALDEVPSLGLAPRALVSETDLAAVVLALPEGVTGATFPVDGGVWMP